jgi:hypothetical protein
MNNSGQFQPFFLIMVGIIIFIIAFSLASPLIKSSNQVQEDMNCSAVTDYKDKVQCTIADMVAPFIIAVILGLGGVALTAKLMG